MDPDSGHIEYILYTYHNHNDPIARAELYQLSYIPQAKWKKYEKQI